MLFNKELTLPEKETPMISAQCYNIVVSYVIWLNILDKVIYFAKSNNPLFVFCALVGFVVAAIVGTNFLIVFFKKYIHIFLFIPAALFLPACAYLIIKSNSGGFNYAFQWQFLIGAIIVCGLYLVILNDSFKNVKPGENSPGRSTIILFGIAGLFLLHIIILMETNQSMFGFFGQKLLVFWDIAKFYLAR